MKGNASTTHSLLAATVSDHNPTGHGKDQVSSSKCAFYFVAGC